MAVVRPHYVVARVYPGGGCTVESGNLLNESWSLSLALRCIVLPVPNGKRAGAWNHGLHPPMVVLARTKCLRPDPVGIDKPQGL